MNLEERYDRTGPVPNKLLYGSEDEFYTNALRRNAYNLKLGDRPDVSTFLDSIKTCFDSLKDMLIYVSIPLQAILNER